MCGIITFDLLSQSKTALQYVLIIVRNHYAYNCPYNFNELLSANDYVL